MGTFRTSRGEMREGAVITFIGVGTRATLSAGVQAINIGDSSYHGMPCQKAVGYGLAFGEGSVAGEGV